MGADQRHVDAARNEGFKRGIVGGLAETVEAPMLQVRDARRELESEQGAEREDVVGKRWPGESGQRDRWNFCLRPARLPEIQEQL